MLATCVNIVISGDRDRGQPKATSSLSQVLPQENFSILTHTLHGGTSKVKRPCRSILKTLNKPQLASPEHIDKALEYMVNAIDLEKYPQAFPITYPQGDEQYTEYADIEYIIQEFARKHNMQVEDNMEVSPPLKSKRQNISPLFRSYIQEANFVVVKGVINKQALNIISSIDPFNLKHCFSLDEVNDEPAIITHISKIYEHCQIPDKPCFEAILSIFYRSKDILCFFEEIGAKWLKRISAKEAISFFQMQEDGSNNESSLKYNTLNEKYWNFPKDITHLLLPLIVSPHIERLYALVLEDLKSLARHMKQCKVNEVIEALHNTASATQKDSPDTASATQKDSPDTASATQKDSPDTASATQKDSPKLCIEHLLAAIFSTKDRMITPEQIVLFMYIDINEAHKRSGSTVIGSMVHNMIISVLLQRHIPFECEDKCAETCIKIYMADHINKLRELIQKESLIAVEERLKQKQMKRRGKAQDSAPARPTSVRVQFVVAA